MSDFELCLDMINYCGERVQQDIKGILSEQLREYFELSKIAKKLGVPTMAIDFNEEDLPSLVSNENKLLEYQKYIREKWLETCFHKTYRLFKSPEHGTCKNTIKKTEIVYDYERNTSSRSFDLKIHDSVDGFDGFSMAFGSCMSCLQALLITLRRLYKAQSTSMLCLAAYFESVFAFRYYSSHDFNIETISERPSLEKIDWGKYRVFYLEWVLANFELEQIDLLGIIERIIRTGPAVIIIDNTFQGSLELKKQILDLCRGRSVVVIFIKSALKLDQFGLELCNCGVMSCYFSGEFSIIADAFRQQLEKTRGFFGQGLDFFEYCLLDNGISFFDDYGTHILNNNRKSAYRLKNVVDNSLCKIKYPFNGEFGLALSPLVYLELTHGTKGEYESLCNALVEIERIFSITCFHRNSFGFRNVNYEYFRMLDGSKYVFKLAVGCFMGVNITIILSAIEYLLSTQEISLTKMADTLRSIK